MHINKYSFCTRFSLKFNESPQTCVILSSFFLILFILYPLRLQASRNDRKRHISSTLTFFSNPRCWMIWTSSLHTFQIKWHLYCLLFLREHSKHILMSLKNVLLWSSGFCNKCSTLFKGMTGSMNRTHVFDITWYCVIHISFSSSSEHII